MLPRMNSSVKFLDPMVTVTFLLAGLDWITWPVDPLDELLVGLLLLVSLLLLEPQAARPAAAISAASAAAIFLMRLQPSSWT